MNRIEGQVAGIRRMIQDDAYCVEILTQVAAVQAALGKVGSIILETHMEGCVTEAFASGDEQERRKKLEELMGIFHRYGRVGSR